MHSNAPEMTKLLCVVIFATAIIGCVDPVESRAVNISNTWTLPQEGFSVFYRYFRDKISWFEADAVCQFHHANLVTVDNGVQFDATRAFLKELDVTSAVWIGLMRPENSARFTWTSSKTLDPASGYWAEAIPAMEQPLCAVVDPVRDFRWHALRCGGPETAAFLCELPVPAWAVDCTVTSIPSLTVQYMSDSGTVQLSRDCGESGTKHISCQGKQDRDSIVEQLQCSDEEDLLASVQATENNQLPVGQQAEGDSTRRPPPHLQQPILEHDILTVVSSNDEDSTNNIEVNPNQIEDTVKNVINKFNLQDLMRSEQAALHSDEAGGVGSGGAGVGDASGLEGVRKPTVHGKKYSPLYEKKVRYAKKTLDEGAVRPGTGDSAADEDDEDDEPMMGDQPMVDELETQPIDIIQQAAKPTADGDYADPAALVVAGAKLDGLEEGLAQAVSTTAKPDSTGSTPDSRLRRATEGDGVDELASTGTTEALTTPADVTEPSKSSPVAATVTTTTMAPSTSTLPAIHTTRTTAASHVLPSTPKKDVITGDHFIPPMLLVKARFISARPHTEPPATTMLATTPSSTTIASADTTTVTDATPTPASTSGPALAQTTLATSEASTPATLETAPKQAHQVAETVAENLQLPVERNESELAGTTRLPLVTFSIVASTDSDALPVPQALASSGVRVELRQSVETESTILTSELQDSPHDGATSAPIAVASSATPRLDENSASSAHIDADTGCDQITTVAVPSTGEPGDSNATAGTEPVAVVTTTAATETLPPSGSHTNPSSHDTPDQTSGQPATVTTADPAVHRAESLATSSAPQSHHETEPLYGHEHEDEDDELEHEHDGHEQQHSDLHNSFSNIENYQPYKPNRHRSLTKPEVHSNHGAYIKKILG